MTTTSDPIDPARRSDLVTTAAERQSGNAETAFRQNGGTAAAIQEDARQTYRQSLAAELPLTGAALGSMFDRGERWGRERIAEVQRGNDAEIRQDDRHSAGQEPASNGEHDGGSGAAAERQSGNAETAEAAGAAVPGGRAAMPVVGAAVTPAVQWATRVAVVIVAAVAAAVSYEHMRHLSAMTGEGWRAWLLPLSVDGLMVAASMVILVRKRQGLPVGWLAATALGGGILASLAANVGASLITGDVRPEPWVMAAVAAWPPVALLLAYELLMQLIRTARATEGAGQ